jgi:hypothetical protein
VVLGEVHVLEAEIAVAVANVTIRYPRLQMIRVVVQKLLLVRLRLTAGARREKRSDALPGLREVLVCIESDRGGRRPK